ncbi:MAG: protein kinase domain-containing protein [Myxococcaceae bacterium]
MKPQPLDNESGDQAVDLGPADPLIGRTLNDRYRIVAPIGVGGMGKVYKAVQLPLERAVALKVLDPQYARSSDPNFLRRFMREASLTSQLRHPNTVTVIDYGQTGDIYYIAMEYLEGQTLSKLLAKNGPLEWLRALEIGQQICRSLREAHNLGVVHRDLKPANIMVMTESDTDLVKVLDFGLVKSVVPDTAPVRGPEITQRGIFLGSPTYMAPEQAKNHSDVRSDIYSLGIVLYQMLTGKPPFTSRDHIELIFAHHREAPTSFSTVRPELQIPQEVEAVVMKCLAKRPESRFQSMEELLDAMRAAPSAAGYSGVFPRATTGTFRIGGLLSQSQTLARPPQLGPDSLHDEPTAAERIHGRLMPLWIVLGGLTLLGGAVLLNRYQHSKNEPQPIALGPSTGASPRVAERKRPAVERDVAPVMPRMAHFQVTTRPEGATVVWKGKQMGVTPATFDLPVGKEGTVTAELTFLLEGYQSETVVAGGSGNVVLMQKMRKLERASPRNAVSTPTPTNLPPLPPEQPSPQSTQPEPIASVSTPPPAALSVPTEAVLPFGEGMSRPTQLEGREIQYTREALSTKVEGEMVVRCVITTTGKLENCLVIKGLPYMNEAVLAALATRVYTPVTFQGRPVKVNYVFNIRLRHPGR